MNTYKDKLADENAASLESLINKAVSKPRGTPNQGDPQPQSDTQDKSTQEIANDKDEEVNTGTGSDDTLKARVPIWVYNQRKKCKKIGAKQTKVRKKRGRPSSYLTKKGWSI